MEKALGRWPATQAREIAGGLVAGAVALAYALSYAALLFSGPLKDLLPIGIGLALVNATIGACWLASRSQLPFALGGPDGNTTSILAAMVASFALTAPAGLQPPQLLALILATTVLSGLVFLALGVGRLGSAVRYIPYPVIGGFLASTGWMIATGSLRVVADLPHGSALIDGLFRVASTPQGGTTVLLGLAYLVIFRRFRHPAVLPLLLLASAIGMLAALRFAGIDDAQARAQGWLFDSTVNAQWSPPWEWGGATLTWPLVAGQWLDMLAVVAVGIITLLLGSSGLEVMSRRDISFDKELREHGWMNLATAALGGYVSIVSVGRSAVLLESGARSRLAGLIAGGVCLLAMAFTPLLLGWLPRIVLAAFLLYLGLSLLLDWVVLSRKRVAVTDWFLIVAILATTAVIGFTVAVLAGIIASCLNFALSYSRLGVVQHDLDGGGIRSSVQRPAAHRALLARHAGELRVLVLRGVIFFGTASTILERVRPFLSAPGAVSGRVLLLDFSHVNSADSSAGLTFTKIAQLAAAQRVRLVLCGLGEGTQAALAEASSKARVLPTLDLALDEAEEGILQSEGLDPDASQEAMGDWMARELGGPAHWAALHPLLERRELAEGEVLMRQGDASDSGLYLIESGRFAVTLAAHPERRLASLMGGTMVGEMALYDSSPRSATVTAERASVVWSLSSKGLARLNAEAATTALQVHAFVMRTMAERVRQANAAIAALQRGT